LYKKASREAAGKKGAGDAMISGAVDLYLGLHQSGK
jgi:hypothetical protein